MHLHMSFTHVIYTCHLHMSRRLEKNLRYIHMYSTLGKTSDVDEMSFFFLRIRSTGKQGCQIFLGTAYQNRGKYLYQMITKHTKWPSHIYVSIWKNVYQMAVKYTICPLTVIVSSIAKPYKIYPNLDLSFETIPSGNPAGKTSIAHVSVHRCPFCELLF
jgi:hypothetical protein